MRGQQVETKNPAQTGVLRGLTSSQRLVLPMLLAETQGFEPWIQVLPRCTLSRGVPSTTRPRLRKRAEREARGRLQGAEYTANISRAG